MNPRKWLRDVSQVCFNSMEGGAYIEYEESDTGGWTSWVQIPGYKGLFVELWYDRYATLGAGPLRLYAGLEMTKAIYTELFKRQGHNFEVLLEQDIQVEMGAYHISEKRLRKMEVGTTFFEDYKKIRRYFFGKYFSGKNLHLASINPKMSGQLTSQFLKKNLEDILGWLEEAGSVEGLTYDIGKRGQRLIDPKLRQSVLEKRNFQCQACKFRLKVGRQWIVEVHHTRPLSEGQRVTKPSDLLVLCPTCHAISHSSKKPLGLGTIQQIRA